MSGHGWTRSRRRIISTQSITRSQPSTACLNGWGRADCTVSFFPYQEPQYREDDRDLNAGDFARLLRAADTRMKAILLTFHGTGIRVSELKFFTVEGAQSGQVVVDNKGKVRTVFLDPGTKTVLLNYCEKRGVKSGVIFRNRLGAALSRSYIWRAMKKLAEKAGVELRKVFPHNIRHLFAVERYKAEMDIEGLRLDMGHSLIATTQRYLKETVGRHYERVLKRQTVMAG